MSNPQARAFIGLVLRSTFWLFRIFLPFEQKEIPQAFIPVFSGHVAPVAKRLVSFYSIDSPVTYFGVYNKHMWKGSGEEKHVACHHIAANFCIAHVTKGSRCSSEPLIDDF